MKGLFVYLLVSVLFMSLGKAQQYDVREFNKLDKKEYIIDEFENFYVAWSLHLWRKIDGKPEIVVLSNSDINIDSKWHDKLSLPTQGVQCRFGRSRKPELELSGDFKVSTRIRCEIKGVVFLSNRISCRYNSEIKASPRDSILKEPRGNAVVETAKDRYGFMYDCMVFERSNLKKAKK